jgi:hypothetical protein
MSQSYFCSDQDKIQYNTIQYSTTLYYTILRYYTTLLDKWSPRVGPAHMVELLAMVLSTLMPRHQLIIQQTRNHVCAIVWYLYNAVTKSKAERRQQTAPVSCQIL